MTTTWNSESEGTLAQMQWGWTQTERQLRPGGLGEDRTLWLQPMGLWGVRHNHEATQQQQQHCGLAVSSWTLKYFSGERCTQLRRNRGIISGKSPFQAHAKRPRMVKNLPAMQETQVRSLGQEDPLEEEMAAHSSILVWEIPWTEKPSRLRAIMSPRAGYNWASNTLTRLRKETYRWTQDQTGGPVTTHHRRGQTNRQKVHHRTYL